MKSWFVDTTIGFTTLMITILILLIAITITLCKVGAEISCNQNVENQPQLVEGDFKLLANECFVTTQNNQIIPWSKYRPVSEIR